MKVKYHKGVLAGGAVGALVWVATIFTDLPVFVNYMAQLWLVKPLVKLFDLGSIGAMLTMFLVCVVAFAIYGLLINMLFVKIRNKK